MKETLIRKSEGEARGFGGSRTRGRLDHNIHLRFNTENIAVVDFDRTESSANIFDEATLDELRVAVRAIERIRPAGVIFSSSKERIFIAGADLDSLANAEEERLARLIEKGQMLFDRIARLPMPTVAAIHGACAGGGLELALACDVRIASDDKSTKIGLPETQLGILPAWGGSTRLPRLVGVPKALEIVLSGKLYAVGHAKKLGLVDEVVPREKLVDYAMSRIEAPLPNRTPRFWTNNPVSAAVIRNLTQRNTRKRTRGNYPAIAEAIEVVSAGGWGAIANSLEREREAILYLSKTEATRNLMRLYFLQEKAKKFRYDLKTNPKDLPLIERTAVIGAGVMGSGIAQWFAARGKSVILRDIDPERVAAGMETIRKLFTSATKKRILTKHESLRAMDRVAPSAMPVPLDRCDLVVEAAVEDLEVKKGIFADLCTRVSDETVLATNTSALPISDLCVAPGVTHPERIVGLHFFNPVSRMKLVEIVVTDHTSAETVERMLAFVRQIGKLPVVVKDSPGFLVNRILMPYLIEAGRLVDLGYPPTHVDEAMVDFGMPMGPLRLLDEVGLDVAAHVAATMRESFGDRFELPVCLGRLLKEGKVGRKSGDGFYRYEDGKAIATPTGPLPAGLMNRDEVALHLAGLMAAEAQLCLDEGVARDADDIDLAMVLGTGFAPFRGGPMAWARARNLF